MSVCFVAFSSFLERVGRGNMGDCQSHLHFFTFPYFSISFQFFSLLLQITEGKGDVLSYYSPDWDVPHSLRVGGKDPKNCDRPILPPTDIAFRFGKSAPFPDSFAVFVQLVDLHKFFLLQKMSFWWPCMMLEFHKFGQVIYCSLFFPKSNSLCCI